jgi:cell division septal protein FtsQ
MLRRRAKPNRRLDEASSPQTRHRFIRVVTIVAVLASGCGGYWYGKHPSSSVMTELIVWADQFFRITSVEINGGRQVSRQDVLARLRLSPAPGLLSTDLRRLRRSLESHPWIQQAEIRRVFPDTLVVDLKEREPAAVLRTGEQDLLIGQDGSVITEVKPGTYEEFPVLTGIGYAQAVTRRPEITERLLAGITLASLLVEAGANGMEVDLRVPGDMVAYYNGFRIRFGDSGFEDKLDRYHRLTGKMPGRKSAAPEQSPPSMGRKPSEVEIDLRFQDRVIVRDKGGKQGWGEKTKSS